MTTAALLGGYRRDERRRAILLAAACLLLAGICAVDLATGPSAMPLAEALRALAAGPEGADRTLAAILWQIRLPTTLMGVLVGASLGVAGLQMQTILDNPLASPFTLGFSAAAGFGAALAIMFGAALPVAGWLLAPAAAFVTTLAAAGLVYIVARLRGSGPEVLVLGGIAVLFLFQALQLLLQYMASPEVLQQIVFWLFGSLLKANWTSIAVLAAIMAAVLPVLARDVWQLTALRLGEAHARSLGVAVTGLRRRVLLCVALLTAGAVAFVGTIGFVGLAAPHAARALAGEDQRVLMPLAALVGAIMLVGASVLAKTLSPGAVLPVGIVTAIIGVPMLFALVLRRGAGERS
ncbi:MAG: iron ABC transporter permease [Thalassobaculum sp.]|uniref:FecCD family ABC transporter permease n=1 Tax=Thalassobaculum sp. TaxID=2022740 RepID=UPI0032EE7E1A